MRSELVGVPREQLHVPVRPLHVALRALLGRRHSDWLCGLSRRLRGGRLRSWLSRRRLLGLGSRWLDLHRHRFGRLGFVLASGRAAPSLGGRRLRHSLRSRRRLWRRLRRLWCRLRDRLCRHRLNFIRHFFNSFFMLRCPGTMRRKRWCPGCLLRCRPRR